MTIAIEYSKKFENKNNEVKTYYLEKIETDRNLAIKINELVDIVHNDNDHEESESSEGGDQ